MFSFSLTVTSVPALSILMFLSPLKSTIAPGATSDASPPAVGGQLPALIRVIRFRASSHRRSHACTGHHTRCNQHCQQLFGRAAFAASILRDFRNNNVSIACFVPNYFKYLVHATFLQNAFLIFIYLRGPNPREETCFIM